MNQRFDRDVARATRPAPVRRSEGNPCHTRPAPAACYRPSAGVAGDTEGRRLGALFRPRPRRRGGGGAGGPRRRLPGGVGIARTGRRRGRRARRSRPPPGPWRSAGGWWSPEGRFAFDRSLSLTVDGVTDPGNLGALLRSAIGDLELTARLDWQYVGDMWFHTLQGEAATRSLQVMVLDGNGSPARAGAEVGGGGTARLGPSSLSDLCLPHG